MWINSKIVNWLGLNVETVNKLTGELSGVRAERDFLIIELAKSQISADWFRIKINQLEMERTSLIEKAYDIKLPTPQLVQQHNLSHQIDPLKDDFTFEDVGDQIAKKLGFPLYDN